MNEALQRQLQANIDAFVANIAAICAQAVREEVENALAETSRLSARTRLAATSTSTAPRRGRPPKAGRGSSLDVDTVFAEVKRGGGRTSDVIAKTLGVETRQVRLPLQKLIAAKKVKTKGVKRGMRYTAA